ncbi:WhiB family transcriptional regulator [Modestobacter versicolor]|uniref:Transcriptional regulator WhiB n=2 Tax=Modestobacter versicolor TaxID=429133 RepID=A0A323V308_9ACTN|nr:WhiB family transcriptional regulator [Modestobacter versicolor]
MAEVSWLSEYKTQAAGSAPAAYGQDVLGMAGVFDAAVPGVDAEDQGWQERALCAETDPEAFFPEKGGSTREAKKICTGCEVRSECLEYALANDERFGIWGGLSERERRRLRRRAG